MSSTKTGGTRLAKRCWTCSYILDGLPTHQCPECGRPFDPDDAETYWSGVRKRRHWTHWAMVAAISMVLTPIHAGLCLSVALDRSGQGPSRLLEILAWPLVPLLDRLLRPGTVTGWWYFVANSVLWGVCGACILVFCWERAIRRP